MFQVASCSSFLMAFYFSQLLDVWYCFTLISEDCWNIGCWDQALGCRKRGESPCSAINTTICAFFFFWIIYDHIQHNTYVENNLWITFTKWVFPYPLLISFIPQKKTCPLSRASILNRFFFWLLRFTHSSIIQHLAVHVLMSIVFFLRTDLNL
jgi:hypothetical protein